MLVQEALQEKKIAEIAENIIESGKRIILIAGPSSSGKTTFSHRLSIQLRAHGLRPHPIPVDNYFVNREDTPLDAYGKPNFECLEALDIKELNKDLQGLLAGEEVELPIFNFVSDIKAAAADKLSKYGILWNIFTARPKKISQKLDKVFGRLVLRLIFPDGKKQRFRILFQNSQFIDQDGIEHDITVLLIREYILIFPPADRLPHRNRLCRICTAFGRITNNTPQKPCIGCRYPIMFINVQLCIRQTGDERRETPDWR